jgi:hypothetical protein
LPEIAQLNNSFISQSIPGFSSDAFFAGTMPAISPTIIETRVAIRVPFRLKANSKGMLIFAEIRIESAGLQLSPEGFLLFRLQG